MYGGMSVWEYGRRLEDRNFFERRWGKTLCPDGEASYFTGRRYVLSYRRQRHSGKRDKMLKETLRPVRRGVSCFLPAKRAGLLSGRAGE